MVKQPRARNPEAKFEASNLVYDASDAKVRARLVFGELGSRDRQKKEAEAKSRTIGGVKVPPRPEEPTNCCMSGCVNCVWELYKDEIEEWRANRGKAKLALLKTHTNEPWPMDFGPEPEGRKHGHVTMEDVQQERLREQADEEWNEVDMGIRVFVETEKKIKQRRLHRQVAT